MFTKQMIIEIAKEQLALECGCLPGDFDKRENIITPPAFSDKRRKFADRPFFFKMTTMGGNAVISADERLHEWLHAFVKDKAGHRLFEHNSLSEIDKKLGEYEKKLYSTHHMFLPTGNSRPPAVKMQVKWFEEGEIGQFYADKRFPNALCEKYTPERPDTLAVAATEGDRIMGMAGCSADTGLLWQIGIDVEEEYRGRGIGKYLVSLLKDEISARGKIPYYGTSLSNIFSWRIALGCGFVPAWVDLETKEG